jgi:hypothetical protein
MTSTEPRTDDMGLRNFLVDRKTGVGILNWKPMRNVQCIPRGRVDSGQRSHELRLCNFVNSQPPDQCAIYARLSSCAIVAKVSGNLEA